MGRPILTLTLTAIAVCPLSAEWPRHKVKPGTLPGIPCMPYQPADARSKGTVTAVSLVRVPVTPAPSATVLEAPIASPQLYQLSETRLQLDHCFLSRVAVTLHSDGRYQLSLRADQNPQPGTGDIRSPMRPGETLNIPLQTSQLRRNQFTVKVRGYGAFPVLATRPSLGPGQPVLVELPVETFWVQRGEPYSGFFEGRHDSVRQFLPLLDRVEVEFTYK